MSINNRGRVLRTNDKRVKNRPGERKCYVCKKFLPLTDNYFYKRKKYRGNADKFKWECKTCYVLTASCRRAERTKKFREEFIKSHGNKCNRCGIYNENHSFFDFDHITPVINKHQWVCTDTRQRQVLCPNCHRLKIIEERLKGVYPREKKFILAKRQLNYNGKVKK